MGTAVSVTVAAVIAAGIAIVYLARRKKKGQASAVEPSPAVGNQEPEGMPSGSVAVSLMEGRQEQTPAREAEPEAPEKPSDTPLIPGGKPDMDTEKEVDADLRLVLEEFGDFIDDRDHPRTCAWLRELVREAYYQCYKRRSYNRLPYLYRPENFPVVYDYRTGEGDPKLNTKAYYTMIGWIVAMQLAELMPTKRNAIYTAGYKAGGYSMKDRIFGYSFYSDPNVARLTGSAIYSAMRTVGQPDIKYMREEVGGKYNIRTLERILDEEPRTNVGDEDFYVDLRKFMASAPGPYAPKYRDRSRNNPTFPDEKAPNGCLQTDLDIYNSYVESQNLDGQRAVQAIADEDGDLHHLFGSDMTGVGGRYDFNAVFGPNNTGLEIDPDGCIAGLVKLAQRAGGSQRGILQHAKSSLGAIEYGRLRPGCSEEQECRRKSYTDDRLNVLTKFVIEDNDGHKETYTQGGIEVPYYDGEGHWTKKSVQSEQEYEDLMKDSLYANSYPSGHSSGIWSAAMTLIEIYPSKADVIMRAANAFAESRAVARFHWPSDTIQGRVAGSVINPVCHASSDYDSLLYNAIREACKH